MPVPWEEARVRDPTKGERKVIDLYLKLAVVGLALLIVAGMGCGPDPRREEGGEVYLWGQGPYRGRVIDAETQAPIEGAVVVAVWYYDVFALVQTNTMFHDALEVLTDAQGYFVVNAPAIERRAPRQTRFPVFTIFKPGYLYFRGWFASPEEMAERPNRDLLGVVELEPIAGKGRKKRQENLGVLPGGGVPDHKIPKLISAYAEELEAMKKEER
jgi:hypothetical protein